LLDLVPALSRACAVRASGRRDSIKAAVGGE
jgi:hypothetical protein